MVNFFHLLPRGLQFSFHGPVHQVEIQVVEPQVPQACLECSSYITREHVAPPQLRGHEYFIPRDPALPDSLPHRTLVTIQGSRVDMPVTYVQRRTNGTVDLLIGMAYFVGA